MSTFCLFPQISLYLCMSIHFCLSTGLCLSNTAARLISFPISYIHRLTTAFSLFLPFYPLSSTRLRAPSPVPFHPPYSLPQPEPRQAGRQACGQAGRLPGWGPRWCSGKSASSGSLSLQDGRTALLWPIWQRPVLAPVCDYGPAGGRQGWHSERTAAVHRLNCGETH